MREDRLPVVPAWFHTELGDCAANDVHDGDHASWKMCPLKVGIPNAGGGTDVQMRMLDCVRISRMPMSGDKFHLRGISKRVAISNDADIEAITHAQVVLLTNDVFMA
jgi:hypothetical protein